LPPLRGLLARLAAWARRRGRLIDVIEAYDGLAVFREYPSYTNHLGVFWKTEKALDEFFRVAERDAVIPDYALAFRHVICNVMRTKFVPILALAHAAKHGGKSPRLVGADQPLLVLYRTYWGRDPEIPRAFDRRPSRLLNGLLAALIALHAATWIVRRLRLLPGAPAAKALGIDCVPGRLHAGLLDEVVDDPRDAVVVYRGREQAREFAGDPALDAYERCAVEDGYLSPWAAAAALAETCRDLVRLWRHIGGVAGELFTETAALAEKRQWFRALTRRYRFTHFLARDDYNPDHIVRTQEFRRAGVRSVGYMHGMPAPETLQPVWRYIDYDVYFTFGRDLYDRYYKKTWSPATTVKTAGTFGMSRAQRARLGHSRPANIVYFVTSDPKEPAMIDAVIEVARAFPDRTVYVKIKPTRRQEGKCAYTMAICSSASAPPNLVETDRDSYEVMLECRYAISGPNTTIPAETLQFGLATFVYDTVDGQWPSYYREFPGLSVTGAAEIIERIRGIERGTWSYPWRRLDGLVDFSGESIFDAIRRELGRAPRDPSTFPAGGEAHRLAAGGAARSAAQRTA
jgi:hypothetical protein